MSPLTLGLSWRECQFPCVNVFYVTLQRSILFLTNIDCLLLIGTNKVYISSMMKIRKNTCRFNCCFRCRRNLVSFSVSVFRYFLESKIVLHNFWMCSLQIPLESPYVTWFPPSCNFQKVTPHFTTAKHGFELYKSHTICNRLHVIITCLFFEQMNVFLKTSCCHQCEKNWTLKKLWI